MLLPLQALPRFDCCCAGASRQNIDAENGESKIKVLRFLLENTIAVNDEHHFYSKFIGLDIDAFFMELEAYGIFFNYRETLQLSIYEVIETVIHSFSLVDSSNAYVQYYLDFALDYSQKSHPSIKKELLGGKSG